LTASPFQLPEERLEAQLAIEEENPDPSLSGIRRALRRLVFPWTAPREIRDAVRDDACARFSTPESVLETISRFSPLHGGEAAETELGRLAALCDLDDPVPAYRRLLRHAGRSPAAIVRYVRESTLHVDAAPAVMKGEKGERPFHPLETAVSGVGQCTGAAVLAAALIETAGYRARLWAVPGHSFLAWQSRSGRWQLEDVDLFPPEIALPRGLSMSSLLESYSDWAPILDALPTMNLHAPSGCFVPTDGGQLLVWHHPLTDPERYDLLRSLDVGSTPRQRRLLKVRAGARDGRGCLLIDNPNPGDVLLMVCDRPFEGERPRMLDRVGIQHDIFHFARTRGCYDDHLAHVQRILYARIPAGADANPVPLHGLDTQVVSVFSLPPDNARAEPFLIRREVALEPPAAAAADGAAQPLGGVPRAIRQAQATFAALCEADDGVSAAAARYALGTGPERAYRAISALDLPTFRGRVLDAACGTGDYAIALSETAEFVVGIDCTAERVEFLRAALDRLDPRPPIEPVIGSIEDMPFEDGEFDAVFCRGAVFLTDLPRTLGEFHRVLKSGGHVYIDCNADAWNLHLMLERNEDAARQGRDTLYNTVWRRFADESLPSLAASIARNPLRISPDPRTSVDDLLDEMDRHLRPMPPFESARVRHLELQARRLCGEDHLGVILSDILSAAAGRQAGPTVTVGSQAWQPEEVEAVLQSLGFTGFEWWSEAGSRKSPGKRPLELGAQIATAGTARRHLRGSLTTWHALFRKPAP